MSSAAQFLNPSQAARLQLGVSAKALRIYEEHGLITPLRTASGWRTYGPAEMTRAAEIAALRALGLSLAQVGRVLSGDPSSLSRPPWRPTRTCWRARSGALTGKIEKVRLMRADLERGQAPAFG